MYIILGFVSIALIVLITSPFWVRKLNDWFVHSKSTGYRKLIKGLRAMHMPLAVALLVVVVIHGYFALGSLQLHTGTVTGISFYVTAMFGLLFYLKKKKTLFTLHKTFAFLSVIMVAVHLVAPGLFRFAAG